MPVKTHLLIVLTFVVALPRFAIAANECEDLPNGPARILACTRQIEAGKKSGQDLADYYYNRGAAYNAVGDYDRALSDFSEDIRRDPKSSFAYYGRGFVYSVKGDYDRSIADLDEAIWLDPQFGNAYQKRAHAYAWRGDNNSAVTDYSDALQFKPEDVSLYYNRGLAEFFSGSMPKALADFKTSSERNPKDAYAAIWLNLAERRSNLPDHLEQSAAQLDDKQAWPAPVVRFLLGQLTSQEVLAAANNKDTKKMQEQTCEANFYLGEFLLLKGSKDEAKGPFRLALNLCPREFIEWAGAKAELKTLGVQP